MAQTFKNKINSEIKRLYEIRALKNALEKEEKALKADITVYMVENGLESFETALCNVKFRHVPRLTLDESLGFSEVDLIDLAMKLGWSECVKLTLNKTAYHERSKEVNNGESVFLESDRLDLIFTFKKVK